MLLSLLLMPVVGSANPVCGDLFSYSKNDFTPEKYPLLNFLNPLYTLKKGRENPDLKYFNLVEGLGFGIGVQAVGTTVARYLSDKPSIWFDSTKNSMNISLEWFENYMESFLGYQVTQVFRNTVALSPKLTGSQKLFVNWYYSFLSYSAITAGPLLYDTYARGNSVGEMQNLYTWSLVGFAAMWPVFSQTVSNKVTAPLLFHGFAKKAFLDQVYAPGVTTKSLTDWFNKEELRLQNKKRILMELQLLLRDWSLDWKKVSRTMIELQGTSDFLELSTMSQSARQGDKKALEAFRKELALRVEHAGTEVTSAKMQKLWVKYFRANVGETDPTPRSKMKGYNVFKAGTISVIASSMIVAYFKLRWAMVGDKITLEDGTVVYLNDGFIQKLIETIVPSIDKSFVVTADWLQQTQELIHLMLAGA
ncbi:MAG: hypothetical protein CL677_05470 [Bdellovibrionaceae bacterium]|nr:hypothetical protein [Pseudobdellovibrionaceae bacterium]